MNLPYLNEKEQLGVKGLISIIKVEFYALKSNMQIIYKSFITPFLYFVFYVLTLGTMIKEVVYEQVTMSYLNYAFAGIIAIIIFKEMFTCVYRVIIDRRSKLLNYKLYMGVNPIFYFLGMSFIPIFSMIIEPVKFFL